jgi:hypothetical protein
MPREVKSYIKRVEKLIRLQNNRERIEVELKTIARLLGEAVQSPEAVQVVRRRRHVEAYVPWVVGWKKQASAEIQRVLLDADPIRSGVVIAAVHLLQRAEPHRFISPLAFRYALASQWRRQVLIGYYSYWNEQTGKVKRIYRGLPKRVTELIAEYLTISYERFVRFILEADRKQTEGLVPLISPLTS